MINIVFFLLAANRTRNDEVPKGTMAESYIWHCRAIIPLSILPPITLSNPNIYINDGALLWKCVLHFPARVPSSFPQLSIISNQNLSIVEGVSSFNPGGSRPWFAYLHLRVMGELWRSFSHHFKITPEYLFIPSTSTKCPHMPPGRSTVFFTNQLEVGLRFPLHSFLLKVSSYFLFL